jgi:hypothetical protein
MAFQDMDNNHIPAAVQAAANTSMTAVEGALASFLRNLSEEENSRVGSVDEKNKLFINKVKDYQNTLPGLSSPDVDWPEFTADFGDRQFLEMFALRLTTLAKSITETRRLHDYDNYQNALIDYKYTKYKNATEGGAGYDTKEDELKQFFEHDALEPDPEPEA